MRTTPSTVKLLKLGSQGETETHASKSWKIVRSIGENKNFLLSYSQIIITFNMIRFDHLIVRKMLALRVVSSNYRDRENTRSRQWEIIVCNEVKHRRTALTYNRSFEM